MNHLPVRRGRPKVDAETKKSVHIGCYFNLTNAERIAAVKSRGYTIEQLILLGLQTAEEWIEANPESDNGQE